MDNTTKIKRDIEKDVDLSILNKFVSKYKLNFSNLKENTNDTINSILRKLRQFGKQKDAIDLIQMENIINEELIKIVNSRQIQAHDEAPYDSKHTIEIKSSDEVTDGDNSYVPVTITVKNPNNGLSVTQECNVYKKAIDFVVIKNTPLNVNQDKYRMMDLYPKEYQTFTKVPDKLIPMNMANMSQMFMDCKNLVSNDDIANFDTSKVTDMTAMFKNCNSIKSIDCSKWNTSKLTKITDGTVLGSIFSNCNAAKKIDVSNFNTSNLTDLSYMFCQCNAVEDLDVSKFDTSKATNMQLMFGGCEKLKSIDVTHFNTSNVTNMHGMFCDCSSLTTLDVSNFNTSNVTNMNIMFGTDWGLTTLDLTTFDVRKVKDMDDMFQYCNHLTSLNISNWQTNSLESCDGMFSLCIALTTINLGTINTSKVKNMTSMFANCPNLTTITGTIDMASCLKWDLMFENDTALKNVRIINCPKDFFDKKVGIKSSQVTIVNYK